jgi:predicted PurR-regulated permease PerM
MPPSRLSPTAKRIIITALFVGALALLYAVRSVLAPFVLASVLAYVLNPLVEALMRVTRRSRSTVVALLYVALLCALILTVVLITPTLVRQIRGINVDFEAIGARIHQMLLNYQHIEVAGFSIDLFALGGEVGGALQSIASFVAARTSGIVYGVLSWFVWVLLTLLVSFYFLKDAYALPGLVQSKLSPAYSADVSRLVADANKVLSNYLRGQLLLAIVVGVATWAALALAGVRYALLLGVLAGVLEIIPNVGPVLASLPAIAIAMLEGSTHLPMSNHWFALLVIVIYLVIQQLENHILVPRIIGDSVNLHPVVVMFAVLAGAALAGILGILLAVPVVAIGRILAVYVYDKLRE